MTRILSRRTLLLASLGLLSSLFSAVGIRNFRLAEITSTSDLIAVVEIRNVQSIGVGTLQLNGQTLGAKKYKTRIRLVRSLQGTVPDEFDVEYLLPTTFAGYRGLEVGTALIFLRQSEGKYEFSNPYWPSFPVAAALASAYEARTADVSQRIVAELANTLASSAIEPNKKMQIMLAAYAIPPENQLFARALSEAVNSTDDTYLKRRLQADLISRNNVSQVIEASRLLTSQDLSAEERHNFIYAIANRLTTPGAVPYLRPLLESDDDELRIAAAEALWHIAGAKSVSMLVPHLRDTNHDVRYYIVRALADITGQNLWGPSPAAFYDDENKYVTHWLEWAKNSGAATH